MSFRWRQRCNGVEIFSMISSGRRHRLFDNTLLAEASFFWQHPGRGIVITVESTVMLQRDCSWVGKSACLPVAKDPCWVGFGGCPSECSRRMSFRHAEPRQPSSPHQHHDGCREGIKARILGLKMVFPYPKVAPRSQKRPNFAKNAKTQPQ